MSFYDLAMLSAVVFGLLGALVGRAKGRVGTGALLGFLLGIFGLIIIALLPARRYGIRPVAAVAQPYQPYQAVPPPPAVPAQWAPDPSGRHELRWWDGRGWSEHVADGGVRALDPQSPAG